MLCPRWLSTATQPIAVDDVLAYLLAARDLPPGDSRIFEIGSKDITTYGDMIREYAWQKGLRRWLISVPVLTPYLSSLWLALVTPASFEVGRHLIEGLKNPTVSSWSLPRLDLTSDHGEQRMDRDFSNSPKITITLWITKEQLAFQVSQ